MARKTNIDNEVLGLLKRLDLNQYESKVYTSLLLLGTATAGEISEKAGVPRSRVYDVLNSLEKKGFTIVEVGRPVKYKAVSLDNAVNQLKASYDEEYKQKISEIEKLKEDLTEKIKKSPEDYFSNGNGIKLITGKENLYNHINKLIEKSENKIFKMTDSYGLQNLDKHAKKTFQNAKKRGIDNKIIAHFDELPDLKHLHKHTEIRKGQGNEGRFMISDGKELVLVTHPEDSGIWINSPYLAGCLESLFEHAWEKGTKIEQIL